MNNKKKNDTSTLPTLTHEQAQHIVDYLHANYDDSNLDWENYCCTSDVAPDAYNLAIHTFEKAYGIFKEEECDGCGKVKTNGKCTNVACEDSPEYDEDYDDEDDEDEGEE